MTAIGIMMMAGGTAVSVKGQLDAGKAAKAAGAAGQQAAEASAQVAESQAEQLDYNALVADLQSADAVARGADEEARFRSSVKGIIGSQRAGFAAQGVDVGSGSAVDVQADAAYLGELDALSIKSNAQREAWGFSTQAEDLRLGAGVARKGAAAARVGGEYAAAAGRAGQTAARYGAAASVLGNGSSMILARYGWDTGSSKPPAVLPSRRIAGMSPLYRGPG
jgi:hypothetical protein